MEPIYREVIAHARTLLAHAPGALDRHTARVADLAERVLPHLRAVDATVVRIAVWWHDVGRIQESEGHEKVSARMARQALTDAGAPEAVSRTVYHAILRHNWRMQPYTLEGQVVRDADKLDWVRGERWTQMISDGEAQKARGFAESLAKIRTEILHLAVSRTVFDQLLQELHGFLRDSSDPAVVALLPPVAEYLDSQ